MGISILTEWIEFLMESTKVFLCISVLVRLRIRRKLITKLPLILGAELIILMLFKMDKTPSIVIVAVHLLFICITMLISFQEKILKIIGIYIMCQVGISIIDMLIYLFVNRLPGLHDAELVNNETITIILNSISLILLLIIALIQRRNKSSIIIPLKELHWSYYLLIIWFLFFFSFMVGYVQMIYEEDNNALSNVLLTIMAIATSGILGIVIIMSKATYNRDKYKALAKMNEEYLEIQQQYYILLSDRNQDIRKFRHDITNHFLCLRAITQEGDMTKVVSYLNDLIPEVSGITKTISTGSNVADAIINEALSKHPEVTIVVSGSLPNPLLINAVDICTIFSNAINNAWEAVSKLSEGIDKRIYIEIKNWENNIYITINNPVVEKVLIINNEIGTSKSERSLHGFGLSNIKRSVTKYQGTTELTCTDTHFTIEIILKNEK